MVRGQETHSIIKKIFDDVKGHLQSEQLQVNCPICQERDGLHYPDGKYNLEINTSKRVFRCWKCDEPKFSGSLGRLIKMFGSYADYEIYKSYGSLFGDDFSNEINLETIRVELPNEMILFSQIDVNNPEHFEAYNYLVNERKINRDIILKYRIGFCITGRYTKRIIIPSYDKDGQVNYFVARKYDKGNKKKPPYDNPKSNKDVIIFNEGFINWDSTVFIVEGVFEMLSLPTNTVPLLGKILSTALFLKLKEMKPNVIIILDPDAYKNSIDLYFQLQTIYVDCEDRIKLVKLPFEKDLDLIRVNRGIDEVIKCLYGARDLNIDDYFIKKMETKYVKGTRRYGSYSKNNQ